MERGAGRTRIQTRERATVSHLLIRTYGRFQNVNGHIYAAAIAYFSLISLFPWLVFIVTMLTILVRDPAVQAQIISQVVEQFPPGARIRIELRAFVAEVSIQRSGLLGILGLLTTVIAASEAFRALRFALNAIFGVEQRRSPLRGRGIDLLGMIVVFIFGTMAAGVAAILRLDWIDQDLQFSSPEDAILTGILRYVLPFLLSFVAFMLMYRVVPEIRLPWNVLWIPGLIAALGLETARLGMALFLNYFERFNQLYGALSVTVVALVFVFLVANIVLIAGAIAREIYHQRNTQPDSTTQS